MSKADDSGLLPPSCGPANGLSNEDLVSVALESYGRSFIYPDSKVNHDRWVECRAELLSRLSRLADSQPVPAEPLCIKCGRIRGAWNGVTARCEGDTDGYCEFPQLVPVGEQGDSKLSPCPKCQDCWALQVDESKVLCGRCGFNAPIATWNSRTPSVSPSEEEIAREIVLAITESDFSRAQHRARNPNDEYLTESGVGDEVLKRIASIVRSARASQPAADKGER